MARTCHALACSLQLEPAQPPVVFTLRRRADGGVAVEVAGYAPPRLLFADEEWVFAPGV